MKLKSGSYNRSLQNHKEDCALKDKLETVGVLTIIVGVIGLLVFSPVITFGLAWVGGGTTENVCGRHNCRWHEPDV